MGRGGGKVAGAKSSVAKTGGGGGGGGGTTIVITDPKILGFLFVIAGFVFMILTIAVPVSMVVSPAGTPCSNADSLNRNEQAVCIPDSDQVGEDFKVEYDRWDGDGYVRAYRGKKTTDIITRAYYWFNYKAKLKGSYDYFSFSVPISAAGYMELDCDGKKCDKVNMYLLPQSAFYSAVNDDTEEFDEDKAKSYRVQKGGLEETQWIITAREKGQYFLVFSLEKEKKTKIEYNISLAYNIYDTSKMEEGECKKGECKFKDIKDDEVVVADYKIPDDEYPGVWCTNPEEFVCGGGILYSSPEYVSKINIHDLDINWSGVAACAVIFALLTLICWAIGALYLYKFLKKIGKLGKKAMKKIEKMEEKNSTQMDAVPAQPAADPAYAAGQPYPGQDPAYAAAPYPGQPM
jgi:hypothetical protein